MKARLSPLFLRSLRDLAKEIEPAWLKTIAGVQHTPEEVSSLTSWLDRLTPHAVTELVTRLEAAEAALTPGDLALPPNALCCACTGKATGAAFYCADHHRVAIEESRALHGEFQLVGYFLGYPVFTRAGELEPTLEADFTKFPPDHRLEGWLSTRAKVERLKAAGAIHSTPGASMKTEVQTWQKRK